jgi:hypothetical protein
MPRPEPIEVAAELLGLRIVRRFTASMFGAALVDGREVPLVLKASADTALATEWETGASMARLLRERGYPAPQYVETGTNSEVTWCLQTVLPGEVPPLFTADLAEQLVALARAHEVDSGMQRAWAAIARDKSRQAPTRATCRGAANPLRQSGRPLPASWPTRKLLQRPAISRMCPPLSQRSRLGYPVSRFDSLGCRRRAGPEAELLVVQS